MSTWTVHRLYIDGYAQSKDAKKMRALRKAIRKLGAEHGANISAHIESHLVSDGLDGERVEGMC